MKLSCPACGAEMTLDVLVATEGAREAVMAALQVPAPLGKLLVRYLALFRPGKRQLSWERVGAILGELQPMIDAGQIQRNGRAWPAPLDYWSQAITTMLQAADAGKLTVPLKSHGYLLEVIIGLSNKAEGKAESAQYQARAVGLAPLQDAPPAHGMQRGDQVKVIDGEHLGKFGRIDQAMPRFARVELVTNVEGEQIVTNDFINVPWSVLQKVAA